MPPAPLPMDIDSRSDNHMTTTHTWLGASKMKLRFKIVKLEYTDGDSSIRYISAYLNHPDICTQLGVDKLITGNISSWSGQVSIDFANNLEEYHPTQLTGSLGDVCLFFLFLCYYTYFQIFRWLRRVENWRWAVSRPMLMIYVSLILVLRILNVIYC